MPRRILVAQALPAGESAAAPIRSVILLLSVAIFSVAMLPVEAVADETSLPATNRAEGTKAAQGAEGTVEQARDVVYASYDGVELTADLYLPRAAVRAPAAVLVHGGAWAWGSRDQMAGLAESLAEQGVAAMNISYRLAPEHKFPAQLIDVAAALGWLRLHADTYRIDSSRVAGIGYSAGGHLVMLLANLHGSKAGDARALQHEIAAGVRQGVAARQDEAAALAWSQIAHLQAIAAGGAPGDLRTFPPNERSLAYWLGSTRTEQPDLYRLASPAYHVTGGSPRTLLFHGQHDRIVPLGSALAMEQALRTAGVATDLYIAKSRGHFTTTIDRQAAAAVLEFLKVALERQGVPGAQNDRRRK